MFLQYGDTISDRGRRLASFCLHCYFNCLKVLFYNFVLLKMSKNRNTNEAFVRNIPAKPGPCKTIDKSHNLKKVHFSDDVLLEEGNKTFAVPEFCTLLQLADELKTVRNAQCSSRSLPEVQRYRNLNFLPGEKMYQDLVGVNVPDEEIANEVRSQPCIKLKKDPDIDVNRYAKYDLEPEYFFTSYAVPSVKKERTGFNGHSIYNKMAMWRGLVD